MSRDGSLDHHIQRRIFNRLVGAESLRYSELKPKEIEANLFMYHLKELIKSGLVEKTNSAYQLSEKGKVLAARFSIRESDIRLMPSTLSVIALRSVDGDWLLYERQRQPYIGFIGWPSGKIHLGETLAQAARRELSEKCGYEDVHLTLRGEFSYVTDAKEGVTAGHVLGHVWTGTADEQKTFENHAGRTFWVKDWQELDYSKFIYGFKEIVQALERSDEQFILDLHA